MLNDDGIGCVLTQNKPADFEKPFRLHLFERDELRFTLERHFGEVWLGGFDTAPHVKADLAARRVKANKVLGIDVFNGRPAFRTRGPSGPIRDCCPWPTS